ncbi:MAG: pirin family protein [Pseudomonadota bacterium]|nr:pirin family protein [Pseudomonadota bacterium]
MSDKRYLTLDVAGVPTNDGAGVSLTRMVGTNQLDMVDPFLMLDRMDNDDPDTYMAGFPDHPHRGFETVTVMLEGQMRHQDSVGNDGLLAPGDIQWITAGRGIIHSEMPETIGGKLKGFQLWANLPARLKLVPPTYQDIPATEIPIVYGDSISVRVLAGKLDNTTGPAKVQTPIRILDTRLEAAANWTVTPENNHNVFCCVYEGAVTTADKIGREQTVTAPAVAVFAGSGPIDMSAGAEGAEILYCEGQPIKEPVVRYGPFVMNSKKEIERALQDYSDGTLAT